MLTYNTIDADETAKKINRSVASALKKALAGSGLVVSRKGQWTTIAPVAGMKGKK